MKNSRSPSSQLRLPAIDALRGIAVILMIEQHLGYWLWKEKAISASYILKYPVIIVLNALGGMAAPLFIVIAGMGSVFFLEKTGNPFRAPVLGGLIIMAYGYILNFLVPSWFSPGSWYVLHMIGLALALSPALDRLSTGTLLFLIPVPVLAASAFQILLNTPMYMGNQRMGDTGLPGWIFRPALVEGHFPVLPWTAFFLSGMASARWIRAGSAGNILKLSVILIAAGLLAAAPGYMAPGIMKTPWARAFLPEPRFYPAKPPITLFLMGCALLCVYAAIRTRKGAINEEKNFLVNIGRISLTLLVTHVVIFRELFLRIGWNNLFGQRVTILFIAAVIVVLGLDSIRWKKYSFRYGLEWAMRKIAR